MLARPFGMSDALPNTELLRSLGRLVRGLSALFWGLPIAFVISAVTANTDWFGTFNIVPPLIPTGLLLFGLWEIGSFQKQERPWRAALNEARLFALVNFGLSPFLFWWNRVPESAPLRWLFDLNLCALVISAWMFLFSLNTVLWRLAAMLPDETLRQETRVFTAINRRLLLALAILTTAWIAFILHSGWADRLETLQPNIVAWFFRIREAVSLVLGLLPLAMTMALIWKTKEVVLDGVFGMKR
jgi:hypothetical protein